MQAIFSESSSGDTYCAVPTKEFARPIEDTVIFSAKTFELVAKNSIKPSLVPFRILAVPKSVILMCMFSSIRMFSGFRSLSRSVIRETIKPVGYSKIEKHAAIVEIVPMNDALAVHEFEGDDEFSSIEARAFLIEASHFADPLQQLSVLGVAQHEV